MPHGTKNTVRRQQLPVPTDFRHWQQAEGGIIREYKDKQFCPYCGNPHYYCDCAYGRGRGRESQLPMPDVKITKTSEAMMLGV